MSGKGVVSPQNYGQENNYNETEETYNKRYLHQLDMGLEELKQIVTSEGHAVKIFLSHAWHEDALSADERNNPDLVRAAKYYDSFCWWLYEALTKAGFIVKFDLELRKLKALSIEEFIAKSVEESDFVLSVCTKLYHDRSEIASTGVGKEVNHITKRIVDRDGEGLGFLIPLLVHYDQKGISASELIPATLQSYNPIYVDVRNRETYVSNLWRVLAELLSSMSNEFGQRHFLSLQLKKAYVSELGHLLVIPDSFSLTDGSPVIDEDIKRSKGSVLATFDDLIRLEDQPDSFYSFFVSHPFHKMRTLANLVHQGTTTQATPHETLKNVLKGKVGKDNDEVFSQICDAVFLRSVERDRILHDLKNWRNVGSCVLPVQDLFVDFGSDVKAACRMYGVSYLWFCWLEQIDDSMIYDESTLNHLSKVFLALYKCILLTESAQVPLCQAIESVIDACDINETSKELTREQVYPNLIQSISIRTMSPESALRAFHLVSVARIPNKVNLQTEDYNDWKLLGQQYLDYFFAKKMLSIETDANTDHYLRLAARLGCQPSLKQWDDFIDQMLLCRDEERCEEDERILLGFVRELKMNMKSVMHHKDNKDRKIVEKIAEYIIKHTQISPSREKIFEILKKVCPEIEWLVILCTLIPRELPENSHGREINSLSGSRCLKEECFLQLYDFRTSTFKPTETNHIGGFNEVNGRHVVAFIKNNLRKNVLCFKLQPEFPIIEQAGLELMYGLFGYPGVPFSEVITWKLDRWKREGSQLFLVSAYMEGIRADEVFGNADHAKIINNLDEQRVGELIIYSILSNPEDGRLQNYIFTQSDREPSLYKIVAIDIDHSFAVSIPQKLPGLFNKETKMCSMLFTLPLMSEPIAESIQERLSKLDVDELFVGWLDDLERLVRDYTKLYNENEEDRAEYETTTLTLPMNYARLMHVYWKLKELKSFVMDYERTDETPNPTYMEALKRVEKYTGDRYEAVNESTSSVAERIEKSDRRLTSSAIRGDYRDYALHLNEKKKGSESTALETIAQVRKILRQKNPRDFEEFEKMKEEFKRLSAAEQEELFVSYQSRTITTKDEVEGTRTRGEGGRRREALDDAKMESKWLDLVSECVCAWQRLIIRHNSELGKNWFVDAPKTAFYNLTLLELHDCSGVTGEVLDILISRKSCRLEEVILSSLENLRTLCARGVLGRQTNNPLELPDLRSIHFIKNDNLNRIHLNSPKLRHLMIEGCRHIEWMSFGELSNLSNFTFDDIVVDTDPLYARKVARTFMSESVVQESLSVEDDLIFENELKFPVELQYSYLILRMVGTKERLIDIKIRKDYEPFVQHQKELNRLTKRINELSKHADYDVPTQLSNTDFYHLKNSTISQLEKHFYQCLEDEENVKSLKKIHKVKLKVQSMEFTFRTSPQASNSVNWNEVVIEKKDLLGEGSFGIVIKATWNRGANPKTVAIKFITQSLCTIKVRDYEKEKFNFIEEWNILHQANLKRIDNIIGVHGLIDGPLPSDIADKLPCSAKHNEPAVGLMMEYIESDSLSVRLSSPALLMHDKIHILCEIVKALADMHTMGFVHGDIKPENVLINFQKPPSVKVIDFGLTKFRSDAIVNLGGVSSVLMTAAFFKGTLLYCSPEGISSSRSSDMYAFGILAWELLSGRKPFVNDSNFPKSVIDGGRPPLNSLPFDIPPALSKLMASCWDEDRRKRKSAVECVSILSQELEIIKQGIFDVFFSHASVNKPFLSHVYRILVKERLRVWYDQNEMGLYLKDSMRQGVESSNIVLICLNKHFYTRPDCIFEFRQALERKKKIIILSLEHRDAVKGFDFDMDLILTENLYIDIHTIAEEWYNENVECNESQVDNTLMHDLTNKVGELIRLIEKVNHTEKP